MGLPGAFTDPATNVRYRTYTNPPSREEAAGSTAFYGVLCRNMADYKLYYLVVKVEPAGMAVAWKSGADAGSGDIRATPDGRLQVTWRVGQNEGAATEWAEVMGYVAPPGPAASLSARYQAALDKLCQFLGL